jgi:hypothetical protein
MKSLITLGRRQLLRGVTALAAAVLGGAVGAQTRAAAAPRIPLDSFGFIQTDGGNLGATVVVNEL